MLRKYLRFAAPVVIALIQTTSTAKEWHVAPSAEKGGSGTEASPFASLVEARDALRNIRSVREAPESDTIWLHDGEYRMEETFELTTEDSGTASASVHWRAVNGARPEIVGNDNLSVLVALYDVENVTLEGLSFKNAVDQGVEVAHCHRVVLTRCRVENIGDTGLHLFGGTECVFADCSVEGCGRLGIRIEAGDRTSLTPSEHRITGCQIQKCGGGEFPMTAAIHLVGVGTVVSNNRITECDDSAIRVDGNDHQIVENEIRQVCLKGTDVGAIYLGHDWTERGNQILRNTIAQVGGQSRLDAIAIYLDDFASGTLVQGNVITSAGRGIAIGGGHQNIIQENLLEDCIVGIQIDSRGESWLASAVEKDGFVLQAWSTLDTSRELYEERYPEMQAFDLSMGKAAHSNRINGNLLQRSGRVAVDSSQTLGRNQIAKNQIGDHLFDLRSGKHPVLLVHNPATE